MTIRFRPTGPASESATGATTEPMPGVIVNGGYVDDDSDGTYVDSTLRVDSHGGTGQDEFATTPGYLWDHVPVSAMPSTPPPPESPLRVVQYRLRAMVTERDIEFPPGQPDVTFTVFVARTSDELVLTSVAAWDGNGAAPIGVIQEHRGEFVPDDDLWEALRTGVHPVYGEICFGGGVTGIPGSTFNDVGDATTIRLFEVEFWLPATVAPPCRGYPRSDALSNSPRRYPPPKSRQYGNRANGYY